MAQSQKRPRKKLKVNKLKYDGRLDNIFKLWLLNGILSIVTLGIYYFWGTTKLRQYFAGSLSLRGDRFEWHGTGKEMFVGYLKTILILAAVLIALIIVYYITTFTLGFVAGIESKVSGDSVNDSLGFYAMLTVTINLILIMATTFYLRSAAKYMAIRYRLARISWRGIHGHLQGSSLKYGLFSLKRTFYNIISLGYLKPHSDIIKHKYIVDNASLGDINLKFNPAGVDWKKLRTRNIFGLMAPILGFICFAMPILFELVGLTTFPIFTVFMYLSGTLVLILAPIFFVMYRIELIRSKVRGLTAKSFRFKLKVTAWGLYIFLAVNYSILLITFGLGKPFIAHRKLKFISRHLVIGGDLESEEIQQAKKYKAGLAEGLDDALGVDSGLM